MRYAVSEDKIYFTTNNGAIWSELWATDGTQAIVKLVYDLNPRVASIPVNFQIMNGFFTFSQLPRLTELWKLFLKTSATSKLDHQHGIKIYTIRSEDEGLYNDGRKNIKPLDE